MKSARRISLDKFDLLVAARRAQKPLPLASKLTTFHCVCGKEHRRELASRDVILCACGRSWVPIGGAE